MRSQRREERRVSTAGQASLPWPALLSGHPTCRTAAATRPSWWASSCCSSRPRRPPRVPPQTSPLSRLSGLRAGAASPGASLWRRMTPSRKHSGKDWLPGWLSGPGWQRLSFFQSFQQSLHQVSDERPTFPPTPSTLPEETRLSQLQPAEKQSQDHHKTTIRWRLHEVFSSWLSSLVNLFFIKTFSYLNVLNICDKLSL